MARRKRKKKKTALTPATNLKKQVHIKSNHKTNISDNNKKKKEKKTVR